MQLAQLWFEAIVVSLSKSKSSPLACEEKPSGFCIPALWHVIVQASTVWAMKLQANCCSLAPLAVLRGVEEQSVLTGEATEKIGHRCQDMEEATEDLHGIRGKQAPGRLAAPAQHCRVHLKMYSNYLVMLTDGTFLPCFHYISIHMSPDGAFQLCVQFISSECSYKTTLAQSPR